MPVVGRGAHGLTSTRKPSTLLGMARSMWMGTLNFGLVSMPVKLYSAVTNKSVHFNQLHSADHARIQQKRVCSADGEEVPFEEIVKGYELAPERYVVIEDSELQALAPEATRTIEIEDFVELEEIDRDLLRPAYYIVPNRGGARSYRLLLQAMRETGKVAIARVVLRSRERLVAVHPREDVLMMTTLSYADEVNPTSELRELGGEEESAAVGERELDVARRLVRVAGRAVRHRSLPRHLPRGRARPDRPQGQRRGNRGAAAPGGGGAAGSRSDGRAAGEPRARPRARRRRAVHGGGERQGWGSQAGSRQERAREESSGDEESSGEALREDEGRLNSAKTKAG